jgi:hypothetical protein
MDLYRDDSSIFIFLTVKVKDTVTGNLIDLGLPGPTLFADMDMDLHGRAIYNMLRRFELHELDEHFYMDGVKIHDPHKDESKLIVHVPEIFDVAETTLLPEGQQLVKSLLPAVV